MPFRSLKESEKPKELYICQSREHNPPNMIKLEPGLHIWVCSVCGKESRIFVPGLDSWCTR